VLTTFNRGNAVEDAMMIGARGNDVTRIGWSDAGRYRCSKWCDGHVRGKIGGIVVDWARRNLVDWNGRDAVSDEGMRD
jgi:hypothetical protein